VGIAGSGIIISYLIGAAIALLGMSALSDGPASESATRTGRQCIAIGGDSRRQGGLARLTRAGQRDGVCRRSALCTGPMTRRGIILA